MYDYHTMIQNQLRLLKPDVGVARRSALQYIVEENGVSKCEATKLKGECGWQTH